MSAVFEATSRPTRSATQPLNWDWVSEWSELETAVHEVESRVRWDWERELELLHRELDRLEARVKR